MALYEDALLQFCVAELTHIEKDPRKNSFFYLEKIPGQKKEYGSVLKILWVLSFSLKIHGILK